MKDNNDLNSFCALHEDRISKLETNYNNLAMDGAVLSGEVKTINKNLDRMNKTLDEVSEQLRDIIPQIKVSKRFESLFVSGMFFFVGLIVSGIIGILIHHFTNK